MLPLTFFFSLRSSSALYFFMLLSRTDAHNLIPFFCAFIREKERESKLEHHRAGDGEEFSKHALTSSYLVMEVNHFFNWVDAQGLCVQLAGEKEEERADRDNDDYKA